MNTKILFPSLLLLSACASAPKPIDTASSGSVPAWVNHPETNYPESRYLVAVGTGRNRDEAIRDAKKQMAESFVVKVKSYTNTNATSSLDQNTSGNVSGSSNQKISNDTSLETNTYLRGAEVKEVQAAGSDTYALVALDKLTARSGLMLEANRIQTKLNNEIDSLESNFTQAKLQEAKGDLAQFQELYGEASALGMSALVDLNTSQSRLEKIENASRNRNEKIAFTVKTVQGETYFERDIQGCINDRGGTVYSAGQAPANAYKVEISVIERPQPFKIEGFNKIRFDLTASVTDANGKLYRIQTTQTETGRGRDAVMETVSDKLSKDLCDQLFNRMSDVK